MGIPSLNRILCLTSVALVTVSSVSGITYDQFQTLPEFTAGGTPAVPAAITSDGTVTLALKAQQRYSNPALANDGAGTYFATPGQNFGDADPTPPNPSIFEGATWNFDFFIGADSQPTYELYTYSLSYGLSGGTVYSFDPTTDIDALGAFLGTGFVQDSQNLLFGTFGGAANSFAGTFDPNANATYDFLLTATEKSSGKVISSGITVQVGTGSPVPDGGSTLALAGLALGGIATLRRKLTI